MNCAIRHCFFFIFWFYSFRPDQQFFSYVATGLLGWTSAKQGLMSLAQGHNAVMQVWLEPIIPRSQVRHSTTEPLRFHHSLWTSKVHKGGYSIKQFAHLTVIQWDIFDIPLVLILSKSSRYLKVVILLPKPTNLTVQGHLIIFSYWCCFYCFRREWMFGESL